MYAEQFRQADVCWQCKTTGMLRVSTSSTILLKEHILCVSNAFFNWGRASVSALRRNLALQCLLESSPGKENLQSTADTKANCGKKPSTMTNPEILQLKKKLIYFWQNFTISLCSIQLWENYRVDFYIQHFWISSGSSGTGCYSNRLWPALDRLQQELILLRLADFAKSILKVHQISNCY